MNVGAQDSWRFKARAINKCGNLGAFSPVTNWSVTDFEPFDFGFDNKAQEDRFRPQQYEP